MWYTQLLISYHYIMVSKILSLFPDILKTGTICEVPFVRSKVPPLFYLCLSTLFLYEILCKRVSFQFSFSLQQEDFHQDLTEMENLRTTLCLSQTLSPFRPCPSRKLVSLAGPICFLLFCFLFCFVFFMIIVHATNLAIICWDNGLSPGRRQAIIWTNAGKLLIGPFGTNVSEILIESHTFSFNEIHFKISSGKWRPFVLGLNVLSRVTNHCNRFRSNLRMADLKMICRDLRTRRSTMIIVTTMAIKSNHTWSLRSVASFFQDHTLVGY